MSTINQLTDQQADEALALELQEKLANIDNLMSYQIDEFCGVPVFLSDNVVLSQRYTLSCCAFIGRHRSTNMLIITVNTPFTEAPEAVQQALLMANYGEYVLGLTDNPPVLSDDEQECERQMMAIRHKIDDWTLSQGVDWAGAMEFLSKQKNFACVREMYAKRALRLRQMQGVQE